MSGAPRPGAVLVQVEHPRGVAAGRALRRLARCFLQQLEQEDRELSILVTTDRRIRRLNREWRQKDEATDVLSFPAGEVPHVAGPRPLGDVVISLDTARRRAREDGRPLERELARYLAHGVLHLMGHDHHTPAEARRMRRLERKLVGEAAMLGPAAPSLRKRSPRSR